MQVEILGAIGLLGLFVLGCVAYIAFDITELHQKLNNATEDVKILKWRQLARLHAEVRNAKPASRERFGILQDLGVIKSRWDGSRFVNCNADTPNDITRMAYDEIDAFDRRVADRERAE